VLSSTPSTAQRRDPGTAAVTLTAVLLTAFYGFVAATLGFAWIKGGRAERLGVVLVLGMALFRISAGAVSQARFHTVDPLSLVEDVIGFAGFTWIGLRARRYWPLCAAALQLLSLGAHLARMLRPNVDPVVYAFMKSLPTLLVCLAIAVGAALYHRRRKRASSMVSTGSATPGSWRRHSPG
jgi:hypothetical protein